MSPDFANAWQKHTTGNLKQTHEHSPPHLILYAHTVPCKNWQRFVWHTAQHQICLHTKVQLSHQTSYQMTIK